MDIRCVSLDQVYDQHLKVRNRRMFIINAQKDILYYPNIYFFSRSSTKELKQHNYINTIRTLEDIKVLSEAFNHNNYEPKYLNHWFSEIYNLRAPANEGGELVEETLSNIRSQVNSSL